MTYELDYEPHSGVSNILITENKIGLYFAPKKARDLSGWEISDYDGNMIAYSDGDWEDASQEEINNSLEEMRKQVEKITGPEAAAQIMDLVNQRLAGTR